MGSWLPWGRRRGNGELVLTEDGIWVGEDEAFWRWMLLLVV